MLILIVEDEFTVAAMLADIVKGGGHQVLGPTADAVEALELVEDVRPDLALLDITLTEGPVGCALARHLLRRWSIQSIFITGSLRDALANQASAIGVIEKPFTAESVLASIDLAQEILNGGAAQVKAPAGFRLFQRDTQEHSSR